MKKFVLVLLLATSSMAVAQDSLVVTDGFRMQEGWTTRKSVSTGLMVGMLGTSLVSSYLDWWHGQGEPFHFTIEGFMNDYSLGIDKLGHAYTSYFYFHAFREIMLWGGFSPKSAFWWSAGASAFFAISVEIGDGSSPWGFSIDDLTGNMLGLSYGMLQEEYPFLKNIAFKWSYIPTDGLRFPPHLTDHYDAHTYWLAFDMHELLPGDAGRIWPKFLRLAVGYSVDDNMTRRELAVGLDFNLHVFDTEQPELLLLRNVGDMIHLPAPAVKFTQGKTPRYYLFHLN